MTRVSGGTLRLGSVVGDCVATLFGPGQSVGEAP
ncbi:hypothetical protein SAMN06272737_10175 [Blastococcus mobilis]|uniref:Uncharacterized protein n=1 Tax=Blastococcus mobilis TaxID=1938746 RepID=A0A238UPS9_9ACTN|nr:hypothetical protein SAMN06272737_10175 [Blastococcus mobilis]